MMKFVTLAAVEVFFVCRVAFVRFVTFVYGDIGVHEVFRRNVFEKVAEALDDLLSIVNLAFELDGVFVNQILRGENRRLRAHRQGQSV